jgi:Icc protein
MLKIAFLTDQHVSLHTKNPFDIDTAGRFLQLLEVIRKKNYEGIILGGDLCYLEGDTETYDWFLNHLASLDIPFNIISGNHDNSELLVKTFSDYTVNEDKELFYTKTWHDVPMIFLDTAKGFMGENQYTWLENQIRQEDAKNIFIFMHHPPVPCGSKLMDTKYAFQQSEKFVNLCAKFPNQTFTIFTGHYHIERTVYHKNIICHITPSSYVNIDPDQEEFILHECQNNSYRELVWADGDLRTNVIYLEK